jgi:8-oxo-dGTP pyrophosphatase MutT (NUDIX family)
MGEESEGSASMPARPRNAATLILLRDPGRPEGETEVLLLQRNARSAFLPGAHVFPGGVVEEADCAPEMAALCQGLGFDRAHRIIRDARPPEKSLGFFVAAIREAFEESGVLLAGDRSGQPLPARGGRGQPRMDQEQVPRWPGERAEVNANPSVFASRLRDQGLKLATDRMFYFAHWITPEALPIRFDARFFVAAVPPGQDASPDGQETVEARWMSPREAVAEHAQGKLMLAPPTFHSLRELAGFRTVDEAIASIRGKNIETRYG